MINADMCGFSIDPRKQNKAILRQKIRENSSGVVLYRLSEEELLKYRTSAIDYSSEKQYIERMSKRLDNIKMLSKLTKRDSRH